MLSFNLFDKGLRDSSYEACVAVNNAVVCITFHRILPKWIKFANCFIKNDTKSILRHTSKVKDLINR